MLVPIAPIGLAVGYALAPVFDQAGAFGNPGAREHPAPVDGGSADGKTPPIQHTLESAVEFIVDDELVEITPKSIRIRKRLLLEHERKRTRRAEQVHAA